jgi:hypothetical protein
MASRTKDDKACPERSSNSTQEAASGDDETKKEDPAIEQFWEENESLKASNNNSSTIRAATNQTNIELQNENKRLKDNNANLENLFRDMSSAKIRLEI